MREMILPLKRTVFLPKGSPGIYSVREIKADVRHYEVAAEGGRVFCSGEADLLVEYMSFAEGKQYPGYESYEQQAGGGSMWQALLTVPFELTGEGDLPCPPLAELSAGETQWFMVSPHALEMEIELCLRWQAEEGAAEEQVAAAKSEPVGWRQITLADIEREGKRPHNLNTSETKAKEECKNMQHDDKVMRMGVSDQGWQITTQEQKQEQPVVKQAIPEPADSILDAAIEEISRAETAAVPEVTVEEAVAEEMPVEELIEELIVEKVVTEEVLLEEIVVEEAVAEEPLVITGAPLLNIQTVETPWQPPGKPETMTEAPAAPMDLEYPVTRRRAAGLPRLHVRHEQMRHASYQVNIRIDDK